MKVIIISYFLTGCQLKNNHLKIFETIFISNESYSNNNYPNRPTMAKTNTWKFLTLWVHQPFKQVSYFICYKHHSENNQLQCQNSGCTCLKWPPYLLNVNRTTISRHADRSEKSVIWFPHHFVISENMIKMTIFCSISLFTECE